MRKLCAAPDFTVGSVHAVSEDGHLLIASNTGSQLPAYAYSAGKVIWVVGAQKIVKDLDEGMKRLREYVLGLETVRARKAYGLPEDWSSFYSKILMFRREVNPNQDAGGAGERGAGLLEAPSALQPGVRRAGGEVTPPRARIFPDGRPRRSATGYGK